MHSLNPLLLIQLIFFQLLRVLDSLQLKETLELSQVKIYLIFDLLQSPQYYLSHSFLLMFKGQVFRKLITLKRFPYLKMHKIKFTRFIIIKRSVY
jgi:hypothetical protein